MIVMVSTEYVWYEGGCKGALIDINLSREDRPGREPYDL
jgi:hypothetical protein